MSRKFAWRMAKLERFNKPERKYVIHVSDPATPEEESAIAKATGPIVIVPHVCKTVEEWMAKHAPIGPTGTLQ